MSLATAWSLATACKSQFLAGDRRRGSDRSLARGIEPTEVGAHGLVATIEGSYDQIYVVALDFRDLASGRLGVHCDCLRFAAGHRCEHLWATIDWFDRTYPRRIRGAGRLQLLDIDPARSKPDQRSQTSPLCWPVARLR